MRIRILGGGWYGCHIASELLDDGHEVELHETGPALFSGASGNNPARLHIGTHYPRSQATRIACQEHNVAFLERYGSLTRAVRTNLYAVAAHDSMVDFGTYTQILRQEIEFVTVHDPAEYGLRNVEGAILCGERHIVIGQARKHFEKRLGSSVVLEAEKAKTVDDDRWDWTIDCTFCANEEAGVDRYEPCLVVLLEGPTDTAVTIMDGPFPSVYPWDEDQNICSLSSARFTPFTKTCRTWQEAQMVLKGLRPEAIRKQGDLMLASMAEFYPDILGFTPADYRLSIRAMPKSAADTRLVDVVRVGQRALRVRAGKIDAILHAGELVRALMEANA